MFIAALISALVAFHWVGALNSNDDIPILVFTLGTIELPASLALTKRPW